jgi:sulfate transport system ATP-binding protein
MIAGLETPDAGRLLFDGKDVTRVSPRDRRVGFVFQHFALFRHMSVGENVGFGLNVRKRRDRPSEDLIRQRIDELLRLVGLEGLDKRLPSQLSGGQRQRVALARALAVDPQVLLLDEPFGSLDATVRYELRRWIRNLHNQVRITSLFVTHDQEEALEIADRVVVVNRGRIEQVGSPGEVYRNPATPFVYRFLGRTNAIRGSVENGRFASAAGSFQLREPGADGPAVLCVRAHDVEIRPTSNGFNARVESVANLGSRSGVGVQLVNGDHLYVDLAAADGAGLLRNGMDISLHFSDYRVFTEAEFDATAPATDA